MTGAPTNRLRDSLSPYLLQHAGNPVDWYPWGDEALERARKEKKPIFLSIGYAACHWCHVMAHESFENDLIARYMNEHFVNVKLDREERPDLDEIYMNATLALSGSGGWPMSVFLTPDLKPFFAGTYFPPDARYGRPGFLQLLESIKDAWEQQHEEVVRQADRLAHAIGRMAQVSSSPGLLTQDLVARAVRALVASFDDRWGGFGGAPKFPNSAAILLLLREHRRTGNEEAKSAALFTLEKMADGGIYDHLGGGFARYSTDEEWLVPHFEKMLYDNAQLARAYTAAFLVTKDPRWERVVRETLDYVLREMQSPEGGFYSAQDADSEGVEGKFYVWSLAEVEKVLGAEDAKVLSSAYDVSKGGNFEGHNILHPVREIDLALRARLAPMRKKLLQAREKRVPPLKDDKVLADWNGFMIHALAEAGEALGEPRYLDAARRAARFFSREMKDGKGRLLRVWRLGRKHTDALQVDHASLALGLAALYQATFEIEWLEEARALAGAMIERFWSSEEGGFYATEADRKDLIARTMSPHDGATPSGNSLAAHALLALHRLTGEEDLEEKAVATLRLFRETMEKAPPAVLVMILALADHLDGPPEIALVSRASDPELAEMLRLVRERFLPGHALALRKTDAAREDDERTLRLVRLLQGKEAKEGKATAHVCRKFACESPVVSAVELARRLDAKRR